MKQSTTAAKENDSSNIVLDKEGFLMEGHSEVEALQLRRP
jgi:hypothetical protein